MTDHGERNALLPAPFWTFFSQEEFDWSEPSSQEDWDERIRRVEQMDIPQLLLLAKLQYRIIHRDQVCALQPDSMSDAGSEIDIDTAWYSQILVVLGWRLLAPLPAIYFELTTRELRRPQPHCNRLPESVLRHPPELPSIRVANSTETAPLPTVVDERVVAMVGEALFFNHYSEMVKASKREVRMWEAKDYESLRALGVISKWRYDEIQAIHSDTWREWRSTLQCLCCGKAGDAHLTNWMADSLIWEGPLCNPCHQRDIVYDEATYRYYWSVGRPLPQGAVRSNS